MGKLANTYENIAAILSFDSSKEHLEKTLSNDEFNWDNIVIEGSKHLVLPAIYCKLTSKQLLHLLPEDLNIYLHEIASLNRKRNIEIQQQINALSKLFKAHKIDHVFLKGAALLVCGYYTDIAERMIGDIDILVSNEHLDDAFILLKDNGYYPIEQTLGNDFFEHKHLPRLRTEQNICAVELHRKLFMTHRHDDLESSKILASKKEIRGISVPSSKHLLLHNILNYQLNDNGSLYNSISFRSAYDTIILLPHVKNPFSDKNNILIKKYFNILALFFNEVPEKYKHKTFIARFYLYKLHHLTFYKFWNKVLYLAQFSLIIIGRAWHFTSNKAYRVAILKDRKRILSHFRSVLKNS